MKKTILGIALSITLLLTACSTQPSNSTPPSEPSKTVTSTIPPTETPAQIPTLSEPVEADTAGTDLFNDVYVPYATRENGFAFSSVESFAENCGYDFEITEPTSEITGQIKIADGSGDYVYFAFSPIEDIESIMTVSFYQSKTKSEVSLENYSPDGSPQYDTFTTHVIGESNTKVTGIDAQRSFLFPQE